MFRQLHTLAKEELHVHCCCTRGGHSKDLSVAGKWDGEHREYLFDMTWYDNWEEATRPLPVVIIEHENRWSKDQFLYDLWKLMFGFAPRRVGIGYARDEAARDDLVSAIEDARAQDGWVFPEATEDLVLLGHGRMPTPDAFLVLHRPRRGQSFQRLGMLSAAFG